MNQNSKQIKLTEFPFPLCHNVFFQSGCAGAIEAHRGHWALQIQLRDVGLHRQQWPAGGQNHLDLGAVLGQPNCPKKKIAECEGSRKGVL